jgi:hypothetical protein
MEGYLQLAPVGKLTFEPREYLSSAAREVKVKPEHSCTGASCEPLRACTFMKFKGIGRQWRRMAPLPCCNCVLG